MRIIEVKCKKCGHIMLRSVDEHDKERNIPAGAVGDRVKKAFDKCERCGKDLLRIDSNKPKYNYKKYL